MLFLALVARFPVFLEFTEMPLCYYTVSSFQLLFFFFQCQGTSLGNVGVYFRLSVSLAHFGCLFRLQIVVCSEIFFKCPIWRKQ